MSFLLPSNPNPRIHQKTQSFDHFDLLPDSLILIIFGKVADVKDLGRFCMVSRRFNSLVPLVENVLIRLHSFISDDEGSRFSFNDTSLLEAATGYSLAKLFGIVSCRFYKPFIRPRQEVIGDTIYSPTIRFLKNFAAIRFLKIELQTGEFGVEDGVVLKWRAEFGSTLDSCVFLVASSMLTGSNLNLNIPDFKLRVVLTVCSLMAATSQYFLLQQVITDHKSLDRLTLSDADGQGVLTMNKEQLQECRVTPLSASKSKSLPPLKKGIWYAPQLDLPDGTVLKGATLVALRLSESKKEVCDASLLSDAFEEPFGTAAKMLSKRSSGHEIKFGTAA